MSNLLASLISSTTALRAFERGLSVTQNNIANANTPGYVKQTMQTSALPFDPALGMSGGVRAGEVRNSRNGYAEEQVRRQTQAAGYADQMVSTLTAVDRAMTISDMRGIPGALGSLFQSFSAWAQDPNSEAARTDVLARAIGVAEAFRQTANEIAGVRQQAEVELQNTVDQVNVLAGRIQEYNQLRTQWQRTDAGVDANLHASLEELAGLANITVLYQEDATVTVLLGGQGLLVSGDTAYQVSLGFGKAAEPQPAYPLGTDSAEILDHDGRDIAGLLTGGRLGGLLQVRNEILPSLLGDGQRLGDLNRLAAGLASEVNSIVAGGWVDDGVSGATGLFQVDAADPTAAARSLMVDPAANAANLPAIAPGPPSVSNGTVLRLAALSSAPLASLDGVSAVQFYGRTAASLGSEVDQARSQNDQHAQLLAQARAMRDEISAVSLNEEAVLLLEYQRAYEATAKMVATLSDLTEEVMNILR